MARYADSLLTEGEQVVLRTRQHWLALIIRGRSAIAMWIGAIILLAFIIWARKPGNDLITMIPGWLALLLLIVGAVVFAYRLWQWSNQDYVITNRRLLKVTGILSKHFGDSSLEKINDAILDKPLLGRMLNYGDLTILTAAEVTVDLYHMLNNPKEFKKTMLTKKHALETEILYVGAQPPTPPLRAEAPMQPMQPMQPVQPAQPVQQMAPPPPMPAAAAAAAPVADGSLEVTQTLARLADLRDSGAITPEEYEQKKDELLNRL